MSEELTYRAAGVDIESGYEAVRRIKRHAQTTTRPEVLGQIGSFGAAFALAAEKYREPVLISGTDGVGTKLKLAFMTGTHEGIGIDAVAYCVNDIICQGAEPLFFLDYLAIGKLDLDVVEQIVVGLSRGCREAGCALIGGETAEMPGFYQPGEYDIAGFVVGVVERDRLIDGRHVTPGDAVIGIASTGVQSSGFSLVRRIVFDKAGLTTETIVPELGQTVGDALLTPTGIYVQPIMKLIEKCDVKGIANISGGGLPENLPRAINQDVDVVVRRDSWEVPPVFGWLQRLGGIREDEMFRTFNMGIGMSVIVPDEQVDTAQRLLLEYGWQSWVIGRAKKGSGKMIFQ